MSDYEANHTLESNPIIKKLHIKKFYFLLQPEYQPIEKVNISKSSFTTLNKYLYLIYNIVNP